MLRAWSVARESTWHGLPCIQLAWEFDGCSVAAYILRDQPRVIIVSVAHRNGDPQARDADLLEVEALAERFRSPELAEAADRMRAAVPKPSPWWRPW